MDRRGQIYILGLLSIFFAVVVLIMSFPSMYLDTGTSSKLDLVYASLNESFKGCFSYARAQVWNIFTNHVNYGSQTAFDDNTLTYFEECVYNMSDYISNYYGVKIDAQPTCKCSLSSASAEANFNVKSGWIQNDLSIHFSREISLQIEDYDVVGTLPSTYLEINFTFSVNGVQPLFVYAEVYFVEKTMNISVCKKVMEGYVSQIDNKFTMLVYIEPKYYTSSYGSLHFILKVYDEVGVAVWEEKILNL